MISNVFESFADENTVRTWLVVFQVVVTAIVIFGLMAVLRSSMFYKSDKFEEFFSSESRILITDDWNRKEIKRRINERINMQMNQRRQRHADISCSDLGKHLHILIHE